LDGSYLPAPGELSQPDELTIPKAQQLARRLLSGGTPFASFVECRRLAGQVDAEVLVFEVEVELGQEKTHDIRRFERIAAILERADKHPLETLALRGDFPLVPHLNLRAEEYPRSLCLSDEPYREVKRRWTAAQYVADVREWLARTAKGMLHADDQELEPLLLGGIAPLVIPDDLFEDEEQQASAPLTVISRAGGLGRHVFIAQRSNKLEPTTSERRFVATAVRCTPQAHGLIRKNPGSLYELHQFMEAAGFDLLSELRSRLSSWELPPALLDACLIIIAWFPKTRTEKASVEATDVWAFISVQSVYQIGHEIGVWDISQGGLGRLLSVDEAKRGEAVHLGVLSPQLALSRRRAAELNGMAERRGEKVAAVGMGALGSQVFLNLVRSGYGEWTPIDEDYLLPHNAARHQLGSDAVGFPKAEVVAHLANGTIDREPIASAIVADVLDPEANLVEQLRASLVEANIILDCSASVAVARHLARDVESSARRFSLFLNPTGSDMVLLAEDAKREVPLDCLEMQYYRELIARPELARHLQRPAGRIRYAHSCRDLTSRIPQALVALHAAIGSAALPRAVTNEAAGIRIWQVDEEVLSVSSLKMEPAAVVTQEMNGWRLCSDVGFVQKVMQLREERLPNETGGILIGAFDMERRIVYVVDTIPSPPDSREWPTLYIRGWQGLPQRVQEIEALTGGMLRYVGEWHSHPDGCSCSPSCDDQTVLGWLKERMAEDGLPALMLIAGQAGECRWLLDPSEC
jgi:hypothetical protein